MTWHYAVPSPPPPKSYRIGYRGYRPNETHGGDGIMVTTTTKTTVRTMRQPTSAVLSHILKLLRATVKV